MAINDAIQTAMNRQVAITKVLAVARPDRHDLVRAEAQRRAEVFGEYYRTTPERWGDPYIAAYESVYSDIAMGRFG